MSKGPVLVQQVTVVVVAFIIFLMIGWALRFAQTPERRLPILRRGFWTDAAYWIVTPFVTKAATRVAIVLAISPIAIIAYGKLDRDLLLAGFGPAARLPLPAQAFLMLVISDFIGYWMHRLFHGGRLWHFHAVHHSSVDLDWLSSVRVHPVNDAIMRVASAVPLVALGFAPLALASLVPVLTAMAILIHSNVDWDFGPLRTVIASPRFHRWHHTDETEARDKNFAGFFPVWDLLFGTYHMPRDKRPTTFGTSTPVPPGLLSQFWFPFLKRDQTARTPARPVRAAAGPDGCARIE
jgi:sterol desaturase/sphingolipid hydroxylase (fatty acid hydroxylase superfamily)